jgi:ubiquinone/menaquinone biosynthesis C-methylase UbiE
VPIMPAGERLFCRTAAWGALARRVLLPWALSGQRVGGEVLEIGSGAGAMAAGILAGTPDARVTASDLDPAMVRVSARRLTPFGSRADVRVADATALPFEDASFDVVVSFLMLHHVGAWETALGEVVRVLRPGGRFLGYDLLDTARSRGIHHLDAIHDLRSITVPAFTAALAVHGVTGTALRRGRTGLTLRWTATTPP